MVTVFLFICLLIFFLCCNSLRLSRTLKRNALFATTTSTNPSIADEAYRTLSENLGTTSTSVRYTGSSGAALELANVCVSVGNNDIINDVQWTIMPSERWGLVGRNGAGKSTLLRAITCSGGETIAVREGIISIAKKSRLGYLEQKGVSGSTLTVREEVTSRMDRLRLATAALELAEKRFAYIYCYILSLNISKS